MRVALRTAAALCKQFEGFRSAPYMCPAGVATVAYGSTMYENGQRVLLTDPPVSRQRGEAMLMHHLEKDCLPAAIKLSPNLVRRQEALGAIADFIYNLGASRYKSSTLRKRINDGDWEEARYELRRWVRANGRVLRGLELRREAEAKLLPK